MATMRARRPHARVAAPLAWLTAVIVTLGLLTAGTAQAVAQESTAAAVETLRQSDAVDSVVKTADLSQFQAGNIISDAVFFDKNTMTAEQIQAFLQSKVPTCQSGYTCLKDWYDTSRTTSADAMCGAYPGGVRERASAIIYKVAQACGINPQVLVVMLQKEQGLVNHTWPSDWRYTIAMGQGCPDTAGCDTRYYGFFNQVYGAAWQLKRYGNPPGTSQYFTWYAPGKTWNVRYSPDAACGSSPVLIQNQATADLYYYTPYQPNAAALRAGYGEGDGCSAYGNRNFYQYFNDWFGSTTSAALQVLQVAGTSEQYVASQGARWRLATADVAAQFAWISAVREVSRSELDTYQDRGSAKRGIRTNTGIIYLLDGGRRLRLQDANQATDLGWDVNSLPLASDAQAARYRDAGYLDRIVGSGGQSWFIQGGSRRQILDLGLLLPYGIAAEASQVSAAMIAEYPTASPVVASGVYRDAANSYRLMTDAGVYTLPDAAKGTVLTRGARELTAESFAFLQASATLPVRMTSGGKSYVLLENGWLEVTAAHYPAGLTFTSLPNGAATGIPVAGRAPGPHFIREMSNPQTYLVSGGTMQVVTSAEQVWITRTYGVSPQVWVGLDGTIDSGTAPEGVVRTAAGIAYLLDGVRAYRFRDCGQVASWGGDCATLPTVTDAKVSGYANAGILQHLVRTPAGTTWLPQGGQFRQVLDPGILAVYGIPSTTSLVSAATAAAYPVGGPVLAAGVYSDGANARVAITEAGAFTVASDQSVGVVRTSARALTAASFAQIPVNGALPSRMRSDARSFVLTVEGWLEVAAAAYGGDTVFTQLPARAWTGIVVAGYEPRPHFVRDEASSAEYLISGGAAQPVSGASERQTISTLYGVPPKVWSLAGGALSGIRGSYELLVKGASGEVYLMDGSTRYRTSGCAAAAAFGKDCASLRTLTSPQLAATRDGGVLESLLRSPDGYVWLPQGGTKREVPDPRVMSAYGIGTASTLVSAQVLAQLQLGQPVVSVGVYDDRAGDVRVINGDGRTFSIPASSRVGLVTSGAWTISSASIDMLIAERDLPTRITAGSQSYVLTNQGWLAVTPSAYAPLAFETLGARAAEGIPSAGSELRPHFVREQSSTQLYLASGGLSVVTDEASHAWIAANYGVPAYVWVAVDGTLR